MQGLQPADQVPVQVRLGGWPAVVSELHSGLLVVRTEKTASAPAMLGVLMCTVSRAHCYA
jgi:hypothetical protein